MSAGYVLREPVVAARYEHDSNEHAVFALINRGGGASFDNVRGYLHCYNIVGSTPDVNVADGQWVVAIGRRFVVLDDADFADLFQVVDPG